EPRLDVIFALLIPINIAIWWRRTTEFSKAIVACSLGIALGFVPVAAQIASWPFIVSSPDGVLAVAAVALFATASISATVTLRHLKAASHAPALEAATLPHHIRRGLVRLYVALLIPWVAWCGYVAFQSRHVMKYDFSRMAQLYEYESQ